MQTSLRIPFVSYDLRYSAVNTLLIRLYTICLLFDDAAPVWWHILRLPDISQEFTISCLMVLSIDLCDHSDTPWGNPNARTYPQFAKQQLTVPRSASLVGQANMIANRANLLTMVAVFVRRKIPDNPGMTVNILGVDVESQSGERVQFLALFLSRRS